ncbi:MAG: S8 family serine peptidase [Firmicutes bacterium]|nr:S8 family serine peptidase [Bacillota bacterium]
MSLFLLIAATPPQSIYEGDDFDKIINYSVNNSKTYIEQTIYNTATLEDNFCDSTVLVVLSRYASKGLRDFTICYFPEFNFASVEDISPGLELARQQRQASLSRRTSYHYYDANWSIDLNEFRHILSFRLANPSRENVLSAVGVLEQRDDVISASPNIIEYLSPPLEYICNKEIESAVNQVYQSIEPLNAQTNDPLFHLQWGLHGAFGINVQPAWSITRGSRNIRVGIIDSGIDAMHPDLSANICWNTPALHRDFSTGLTNGVPLIIPTDHDGHGTHVAGIIGATGNNNIGISGVAQNVSLVSLRVFQYNSVINPLHVINAIRFATNLPPNQRIHILNVSLGGSIFNIAEQDAIRQFPGLFVTAAGNDGLGFTPGGWNNDVNRVFPSNHRLPNLISVGSTYDTGRRSVFSNWGRQFVCLFAPGGADIGRGPYGIADREILSTFPIHRCNAGYNIHGVRKCMLPYNRPNGTSAERTGCIHHENGYHFMAGTSMSAPFVAGVAALMLSVNPNIPAWQVRNIIMDTVSSMPNCPTRGRLSISGGRLNASAAVQAARDTVIFDATGRNLVQVGFNVNNQIQRRIIIDNLPNNIPVFLCFRAHVNARLRVRFYSRSMGIYQETRYITGGESTVIFLHSSLLVAFSALTTGLSQSAYIAIATGSYEIHIKEPISHTPRDIWLPTHMVYVIPFRPSWTARYRIRMACYGFGADVQWHIYSIDPNHRMANSSGAPNRLFLSGFGEPFTQDVELVGGIRHYIVFYIEGSRSSPILDITSIGPL